MAVQHPVSELEAFVATLPSDTEDAPWMVMSSWQSQETVLILEILRNYVEQEDLPWYLVAYLLITFPRPAHEPRIPDAAPDLLMAVAEHRPRTSWNIVTEGQAPAFVLEVSSGSSWVRDSEQKWLIYQAMGVGEFAVFAPERRDGGPTLFGYRLNAWGRYEAWAVDGKGVLWSEALGGLGLFVADEYWLRAMTPAGRVLPTPGERAHEERMARLAEVSRREAAEADRAVEAARREAAEADRAVEAARREAAEAAQRQAVAEIERLREELRRLGKEPQSPT